jgi:hypothetical protein
MCFKRGSMHVFLSYKMLILSKVCRVSKIYAAAQRDK